MWFQKYSSLPHTYMAAHLLNAWIFTYFSTMIDISAPSIHILKHFLLKRFFIKIFFPSHHLPRTSPRPSYVVPVPRSCVLYTFVWHVINNFIIFFLRFSVLLLNIFSQSWNIVVCRLRNITQKKHSPVWICTFEKWISLSVVEMTLALTNFAEQQ